MLCQSVKTNVKKQEKKEKIKSKVCCLSQRVVIILFENQFEKYSQNILIYLSNVIGNILHI